MIKNYLQQLKQLHQDKLNFQSQANRHQLTKTLTRQEDKYQAYIIEQMASQNRIIAASNIADALNKFLRRQDSEFFQSIKKIKYQEESSTSIRRACDESVQYNGDSVSVDFMLVRLCATLICRHTQKAQNQIKKQAFLTVKELAKRKLTIERLINHTKKFYLRKGVHAIKGIQKRPLQSQDKLFNDSFSVIHRHDNKLKSKHFEESCLSFILDKENNNADCQNCKQSCQTIVQKDKEINKMKEQMSYLKHLLAQKTLQLKKKQEQIDAGIMRQSESSDQSGYISHNESYYSQLEKQVFGGKRIRKNGSRLQSTSQLPKEQISKELLGKYMRQSFQYKESMDVARELCLDLQASLPLVYNRHVQQILKVLNFGEEVSLVDEYA